MSDLFSKFTQNSHDPYGSACLHFKGQSMHMGGFFPGPNFSIAFFKAAQSIGYFMGAIDLPLAPPLLVPLPPP